jgi:hypothetical protein
MKTTNTIFHHFSKLPGYIFSLILFFILSAEVYTQSLITTPECVVYDASAKRYLVSCYSAGKVVEIDSNGNQKYFKEGLTRSFSNTIYDGVFYISTGTTIKGFDLNTAAQVMSIYVAGSHQLDGMTTDTAGNLYVADYQYSGSNDQIYKINLNTQVYSVFVGPGQGLGEGPQDLAYDEQNNRLIVANYFSNSPIQAVSLSDSTVSNIVAASIGNFDGVARDNDGNWYFTSWGTGSVHKYDSSFANPPVVVISGFSGPANLCYNPEANILAIPVFNMDTVVFHQLEPIGIKGGSTTLKDFALYQNYPNPFNPVTTINVNIGKPAYVNISVYGINGNNTDIIFDGNLSRGSHSFLWDGTNHPSGVYFYKFVTNNFTETRKMILVK